MVNNSRIIGRAARLMESPSVIESPSGRVPQKASRWDLSRTGSCDDEKYFVDSSIGFPIFEYLYRWN